MKFIDIVPSAIVIEAIVDFVVYGGPIGLVWWEIVLHINVHSWFEKWNVATWVCAYECLLRVSTTTVHMSWHHNYCGSLRGKVQATSF